MKPTVTITSDTVLADVDHHFRIVAGPGAGKTHWLAGHIRNVAGRSTRLTPCSRIAVISYTNVAVREILARLGNTAHTVEATTIHSFLFRNVVRPYAHFLKDDDGQCLIAHELLDTHDEHFPAYDKVGEWLGACNQRTLLRKGRKATYDRLLDQLKNLAVRVDGANGVAYHPRKTEARDRGILGLLTHERLVAYKRPYWSEGTIDHEDVLYLAFRLLDEHPALRRFLSDRFPYLFIDEFQDTLPVQGSLVQWFADAGTTVGVIGDPEQAIFGFLDATSDHFRNFALPGTRTYEIRDNRRSTSAIVRLLNQIRSDGLLQHSLRAADGDIPSALAGSLADSLAYVRRLARPGGSLLVLTRTHATAARTRLAATGRIVDPWKGLHASDPDRGRFLQHVLTAADLAQRRLFDVAVQRLVQGATRRNGFRKPLKYDGVAGIEDRRSVALSLLVQIQSQHASLLSGTALDLYMFLLNTLPKFLPGLTLPGVRDGAFKTAAQACRYIDLLDTLKTPEETRGVRTIHQAKGAESHAVFVVLEEEQIDHCVAVGPADEERRITYVALSRARDQLFVFCPKPDRLGDFAAVGMTTHLIGKAAPAFKSKSARSRRA